MPAQKPPTKAQATRIARNDSELGAVLERGGEIMVVEPARGRTGTDRAVVGVHDPERGRSLVALVDATGVVGVHETPAKFQLTARERATDELRAALPGRRPRREAGRRSTQRVRPHAGSFLMPKISAHNWRVEYRW